MELLEEDIAREEAKMVELEENLDNLNVAEKSKEITSFSSTTNEDGSVSIWNKSTEEVKEIREKFFDNPEVHKTRTREELEHERQE